MMRFVGLAFSTAGVVAKPVQLIIDTDLGFDVDDVGAIAIGNHLQDIGECEILGIVHNTGFYKGIGGVDVLNTWYRRNEHKPLDLGAYKGAWGKSTGSQDKYTSLIEGNFPSDVKNFDQVDSAVSAYKAALTRAEDASVVIASIGELTNLRDILKADKALFAQKVKQIVYMDGSYNFGCGDSHGSGKSPWMGATTDCDGAAKFVNEQVPHTVAQFYSGNGGDVKTGGRFNDHCGAGPVKQAYQAWTNHGTRSSWDLMAVYYAVRGADSLHSSHTAGTNSVDSAGSEHFDKSVTSNNEYKIYSDSAHNGDIVKILDDMLCAAPCRSADAKVGGCSGYQLHSMKNCYGDRDGKGSHGADDMESPASASAGTMTLSACQALCDKTAGCTGVAISPAPKDSGLVKCYRKKNINLDKCDKYKPFEMWVKKPSMPSEVQV